MIREAMRVSSGFALVEMWAARIVTCGSVP